MAVETTTNIAGLDNNIPSGSDMKSEGDDHLRLLKTVLKYGFAGFPGEVLLAATEFQGATVNDFMLAVAPAPTTYNTSAAILFRATHANTGAATLKVAALAAKQLLTPEGTPLRANAITANSWVLVVYDGTNFRMIGGGNSQAIYDYANQLAFKTALPNQAGNAGKFLQTDGTNALWTPVAFSHGQCRLVYVSPTECRLMPYNGDGLAINDRQYRIPVGGVPITTASSSPSTRYWVFAYDDGAGGMALELANTASSSYSLFTSGIFVKTGDPTRTLVGWVGTNSSNIFQDSSSFRFVASWFNRRRRSVVETLTGSTSSTSVTGLGGGVVLFNWADEEVEVMISGYSTLSAAGFYTMEARRNSVDAPPYVPRTFAGGNAAGQASISAIAQTIPGEGEASYRLFGSVSAGTLTLANRISCYTNM